MFIKSLSLFGALKMFSDHCVHQNCSPLNRANAMLLTVDASHTLSYLKIEIALIPKLQIAY